MAGADRALWPITLCTSTGVESFSNEARSKVPTGKDLKFDYVNPYRNFFKHADRDQDKKLEELKTSSVDGVLFLAVADYFRLVRKAPIEFQVYELWYLALHPQKLSADGRDFIGTTISEAFPGIELLQRPEKLIAGANALRSAEQDETVMNDPRTERAF